MKVFRGEIPEWIPICGHVDPYNQPSKEGMDPQLAEKLADVQWCDESTIHFSRYLGIDIMDFYAPHFDTTRSGIEIENIEEGDRTTRIWHTPKGELREVTQVCREEGGAVSSNWLEHLVKGPEDIPALASIFEAEEVALDQGKVEQTEKRRHLIGDDGMLMYFMAGTPMGMMYRVYSGVATLAYLWADAPQALHDLFDVMEKSYRRQLGLAVQSDLDIVVGMDDTSTTTISPQMFEEFNMELTDERARIAHDAGKLYFHHSCGLIKDLLPLYRQTDMDAVHGYTIPPIGNVTVAEGKRALGDKITIIAGLKQLADPMDDLELAAREIREMICEAEPYDHFILGLAAYPNRTMEQTQFVVDEAKKWQKLDT